ncbi:MAG: ABC transporter ATP-binding protein, partial [Janibacter sp.]|nr:ABC transporter ATP-binding protein [Janibacter sp.]
LAAGPAQRFARATAMGRPGALLRADEPEQRLDDTGRAWLGDWLASHAASGRAVLMACHDPEVVRRSGARIVTLEGDV